MSRVSTGEIHSLKKKKKFYQHELLFKLDFEMDCCSIMNFDQDSLQILKHLIALSVAHHARRPKMYTGNIPLSFDASPVKLVHKCATNGHDMPAQNCSISIGQQLIAN